ncbi:MAG: DNA methylase N-4 [Rhodocyclaceae bacterium]|nr:MAG: DNA methylase N-4 [Rhodocyclaceae bacterium]
MNAQTPIVTLSNLLFCSPSTLAPWPGNPRVHSDKQLAKLKASIGKFGFTTPVLTDENKVILSGHGRVSAAIQLGLTEIPIRTIQGLTEPQKRAYVLADNKLAELSKWDDTLLANELRLLFDADIEIEITGFSTAEIDLVIDPPDKASAHDPDDQLTEGPPINPVSRPGDLWQLGPHRLFCGDALDLASYQILMGNEVAQMVMSDPPFNVAISKHVCGNGKVQHEEFLQASGEMSPAEFTDFLSKAMACTHTYSQDGAIHFYCMDWAHIREIQDAALPHFGAPKQLCVWTKDNGGMGTFYRSQHELVFVFKKGKSPHINNFELSQHGRYRTNVWSYPGVNTFTGKGFELLKLHPTVKPVSLIADAIRDCSHRKGIVLDPFAGSGTIFLAAERTGRIARGMELDPKYVDVAIGRWQRKTGQSAVLSATGQPWEAVQAERLADLGDSHGV